jgi:hypothetical protein
MKIWQTLGGLWDQEAEETTTIPHLVQDLKNYKQQYVSKYSVK